MKKYNVFICLNNGNGYAHTAYLQEGKPAQLEFIENNIDNTSTFYTGKEGHFIAMKDIVSIVFELVY